MGDGWESRDEELCRLRGELAGAKADRSEYERRYHEAVGQWEAYRRTSMAAAEDALRLAAERDAFKAECERLSEAILLAEKFIIGERGVDKDAAWMAVARALKWVKP